VRGVPQKSKINPKSRHPVELSSDPLLYARKQNRNGRRWGDVVVVGVSCLDGTRLVLFFPYAEKHHVFVMEEKIKVIGREK
jgi:hypothetical protein